MQTCRKCKKDLPLAKFEFRKDSNKHRTECAKCRAECEQARRYGITVVRLRELKEESSHTCAVCKVHEDDLEHASFKHSKLVVDHDHHTGEVRGLLCSRCNIALGQLDDSIIKLHNAITYLSQL